MHSYVTQDKWEIKIESRDAAAASILLYSSAAASVSLNRLAGELHRFFVKLMSVCDLSLFSPLTPDCVLCALSSHLLEYILLVDCPFLSISSSMNKNQVSVWKK